MQRQRTVYSECFQSIFVRCSKAATADFIHSLHDTFLAENVTAEDLIQIFN